LKIKKLSKKIIFNRPYLTGRELPNVLRAYRLTKLSGDGFFTKKCHEWIEKNMNVRKAFLTHSCTSALEMAALLADIQPGDEVILPSFTFVSTANAFALRGAKPVFVDIRPDTLNIDECKIIKKINNKTKAIIPVHYGGVGCEMDTILKIAKRYNLIVIEDAAHGVCASYKGKELGTLGDFGVLSFHETKNIISGEGGAILINNPKYIERAEIIWQKGTDRSRFLRGQTDKYTWRDLGSSFLPSEITAAFLFAQLKKANQITKKRLSIWKTYHKGFEKAERDKILKRPTTPDNCIHNAHLYYILLNKPNQKEVIKKLAEANLGTAFHYIPLHSSPFVTTKYRCPDSLSITDSVSKKILRLPIWVGMEKYVPEICELVILTLKNIKKDNRKLYFFK
jgi:dTDP-4-amino-4,6-dideoxygalactose transaminase